MKDFFPLKKKVAELRRADSPLFDKALIDGGIENHTKNIRTSFAILKVSLQKQQTMSFLSSLEVITQQ